MKRIVSCVLAIGMSFAMGHIGLAQGDFALHETFSRYAPSVYSIKVDMPNDYLIKRFEKTIHELKEYERSFSHFVQNATEMETNFSMFENYIAGFEQQITRMREQNRKGYYVKGVGFAVNPHYMVTLSTVVKSATLGGEISIMNEYHRAKATLCGMDDLTGVAVLEVEDMEFTNYVDLQSLSRPLPETAVVLSLQRPYDLPASPVSGMIGGYNRRLNLFNLEKFIQSDMKFYPGNEGAPVFSPAGQLVGMIAKEYRYRDWPGVTFIIPAEMVIDSALAIMKKGKRERGWIPGLVLKQNENGILVEHIEESSPALDAGLVKGDLIIGIGGEFERNIYSFRNKLLQSKPNQPVHLIIRRGTRTAEIPVVTTPAEIQPLQ
ncbi:PDZ domain-containing protein [bacterium]|nr:PDZ domain-containing protein [bacterium]